MKNSVSKYKGFTFIETLLVVAAITLIISYVVISAKPFQDRVKSFVTERTMHTIKTGVHLHYADTSIELGYRSCPDAGGSNDARSVQSWLISDTATGNTVKSGGSAITGTGVEDLDNHLFNPCSNSSATVGTAYPDWNGPYLERADLLDAWKFPFVVIPGDNSGNPGLILSGKSTAGTIDTAQNATTVHADDLGIVYTLNNAN